MNFDNLDRDTLEELKCTRLFEQELMLPLQLGIRIGIVKYMEK